jgi:hypothetical protein
MAFGKRGQGAIEYLLLLAAAIVVVSIVITFMATTIQPAQSTGSVQTYEYLCRTLVPPGASPSSITQDCKCYLGMLDNSSKDPARDSNADICCKKTDSLLKPAKWNCPTS